MEYIDACSLSYSSRFFCFVFVIPSSGFKQDTGMDELMFSQNLLQLQGLDHTVLSQVRGEE